MALIVTIIVLLILAGVSIVTLTGDNGLLSRTTNAKHKTTLAGMEEELNLAYMSVYTGKAGTGAINSGVSLDEIYNDASLPSDVKSHIIQIGNANTIRLRDGSQSSITILAEDGAITSNGTPGTNTVNIEIEEVSNENVYWLESDGVYYPMSIANSRVVLDKENISTTEPTGEGSLESGIEVTFIDSGASEAAENSSYVTKKSTSKSGNITTITLEATRVGSTELVVKSGNIGLTGENITITVTPVYEISFGTITNGDIVITTGGQERAKNTKYTSGAQIMLTATGNEGYRFEKWYDGGTENTGETIASRNITVSAETATVTYTATFKPLPGHLKTVNGVAYYYPGTADTNGVAITASNMGKYLGMEVEYTPYEKFSDRGTSNTYRLFYVDVGTGTNGKYGDGQGTMYLKADQDSNMKTLNSISITNKTDVNVMGAYNPMWNTSYSTSTNDNAKYVKYLLDKGIWKGYTDTGDLNTAEIAKYAVGAPSLEMWIDSYNAFLRANRVGKKYEYNCTVTTNSSGTGSSNNGKGYFVGVNGTYKDSGWSSDIDSLVAQRNYASGTTAYNRVVCWSGTISDYGYWLASPSVSTGDEVMSVFSGCGQVKNGWIKGTYVFCPLVAIKSGVDIKEK